MAEEPVGTGPEPPDIRPSGRPSIPHYITHSSDEHARFKDLNTPNITIGHGRNWTSVIQRLTQVFTFAPLILGLVLCLLPLASAQHVALEDPYTSAPPVYDLSSVRHAKTTPLLSSLKWIFNHILSLGTYFTGYDLHSATERACEHVGHALLNTISIVLGYGPAESLPPHGLTKRTKPEIIVEAVMIPVLVALSGMFAGKLSYSDVGDPANIHCRIDVRHMPSNLKDNLLTLLRLG
ncbi:hypothetical protein BD324DRAFT_384885 [Kockovaella imperatae]|uniref:Uncharacterized protein n=1 Tax=Kockovaella imperatae TaxID=4999 RepID=A0A1Y1UJ98_9TREE|nr:hypothetical protein BD324DRAFT_384885 [Kockovaella imperatae]ORX37564.1 hypothetical protein BD324DRAFT_384885 [Kockovaella imperatae]